MDVVRKPPTCATSILPGSLELIICSRNKMHISTQNLSLAPWNKTTKQRRIAIKYSPVATLCQRCVWIACELNEQHSSGTSSCRISYGKNCSLGCGCIIVAVDVLET